MTIGFSELRAAGLICVSGADASAFLHAQLTSDVAALPSARVQYSGYCTPKGRLLATFLVWREDDEFLLQLPETLRESIQSKLARYVLRARVALSNVTADVRLFGVWGDDAAQAIAEFAGDVPESVHEVVLAQSLRITRLPLDRFVVAAPRARSESVRAALESQGREEAESVWSRLDIEAGIPLILPKTQDEYVPQMVNLDLVGGLSFTKGCYPGQEIVARTHYLGRLKQRMYRIHLASQDAPSPGDPLYGAEFGADQASGGILYSAPSPNGGHDALAVIQTSVARRDALHWKAPAGPVVQIEALPYPVPEDAL